MLGPLHIKQNFIKVIGNWLEEVGGQRFMNIHLTLPQEKLRAFYLLQVLWESRGLGIHIRCHWLHLSLLLIKLFSIPDLQKILKEDLKRRYATATPWLTVIELEMLLFSFVYNLCQSDFSLFTTSF